MNTARFEEMEETRSSIQPQFEDCVNYFKFEAISAPIPIIDEVLQGIEKHLFGSTPPIRSYYIRKVADLLGSNWENNEFVKKISFIIDVEVFLDYKYNQLFDCKLNTCVDGLPTHRSINRNIVVPNIFIYYWNFYLKKNLGNKIFDIILKRRNHFLIGQFIDTQILRNVNSFLEFEHEKIHYLFSELPKKEHAVLKELADYILSLLLTDFSISNKLAIKNYLYTYLLRNHFTNAALFTDFTKLVLLNSSKSNNKEIHTFTEKFGLLTQIMNDTIDYLPKEISFDTKGKFKEDALSDYRNKLMTLPSVINELQTGDKIFSNGSNELEVIQRMKETSLLSYTIEFVQNVSQYYINILEKKNYDPFYIDIWQQLIDNKYYSKFYAESSD